MIQPKPNDKLDAGNGARSELTPWSFVRAAGRANLLVATLVVAEFSGIALVKHDPKAFQMGLWLVPFVTLVIWVTAAVLCLLAPTPRELRALGRRLVGRHQSSLSASSDSRKYSFAHPVFGLTRRSRKMDRLGVGRSDLMLDSFVREEQQSGTVVGIKSHVAACLSGHVPGQERIDVDRDLAAVLSTALQKPGQPLANVDVGQPQGGKQGSDQQKTRTTFPSFTWTMAL